MRIADKTEIKRCYKALIERDSQFEGVFYVGVTTTRVFCISTCRARKPKFENVVFYTTQNEAISQGFRPCKICKPTQRFGEATEDIKSLLSHLINHPEKKISDQELRKQGYSPEKVRRWFKKYHGLTFHAFQRMMRINDAFQNLKKGAGVTESAFRSGYESLSGFGYAFKNIFGVSPDNAGKKNIIHLLRFTTPLGPMFAGATKEGVCLLEFADRKLLPFELKELARLLDAVIIFGSNLHLTKVESQVHEYFNGTRREFDLPVVSPGTEFQQKIWRQLQEISFGEVGTYAQQAIAINQPGAVRAVGQANGHNRIAIIIPCHRVTSTKGELTGYGGGIPRKKWLLEHEKKHIMKQLNQPEPTSQD